VLRQPPFRLSPVVEQDNLRAHECTVAVIVPKVFDYLAGKITRRTLLGVVFPCMCVAYFGTLALAVLLFPHSYDWRVLSISQLLYPRRNPQFYAVAASGVAVTGVLLIPFAGYLRRRLQVAAPIGARVGAVSLIIGAICLILAGLVSSQPAQGRSSFPKLHGIMGRAAGLGVGIGLVVFAACGVKGYFTVATGRQLYPRSLLAIWSLTILPVVLVVLVWLALLAHFQWLDPVHRALAGTVVWHLGIWEWSGSVMVFLFLGGSVWLLPEHAAD
jgi:hypothetical protein